MSSFALCGFLQGGPCLHFGVLAGKVAELQCCWSSLARFLVTLKEYIMKQYGAEFLGTFWLVLGGCGSAVLAAAFPGLGIGFAGVALAFGLTVLTMAYAIGHISGCHLNPAVSIGLWAGGRFPANQLLPYIIAQVLGAIVAGGVLYLINPARSTGVALYVGDWATSQLWLFWLAPIIGALLGALAYRLIAGEKQ